jgi:hypothetical protein
MKVLLDFRFNTPAPQESYLDAGTYEECRPHQVACDNRLFHLSPPTYELPPTHSAPPFAATTLPVCHLAFSLTNHPTTSATSSAYPILPPSTTLTFGTRCAFNASTACAGNPRNPGVSVKPTLTAFTVIPGNVNGNSMAHDLVNASIPAFVALNNELPGAGSRTRSLDIITMRLLSLKIFCRTIFSINIIGQCKLPTRLLSISASLACPSFGRVLNDALRIRMSILLPKADLTLDKTAPMDARVVMSADTPWSFGHAGLCWWVSELA